MEDYLNRYVNPYVAQAVENLMTTNPDNKIEFLCGYLRKVGNQVEAEDIQRALNKYNAILEESEREFKSAHDHVSDK